MLPRDDDRDSPSSLDYFKSDHGRSERQEHKEEKEKVIIKHDLALDRLRKETEQKRREQGMKPTTLEEEVEEQRNPMGKKQTPEKILAEEAQQEQRERQALYEEEQKQT